MRTSADPRAGSNLEKRAQAGGAAACRRRPNGPIAGAVFLPAAEVPVGPGTNSLVVDENAVVVELSGGARHASGLAVICDWDACWLGDARIERAEQWADVIAGGRLEDVTGAFVLAWAESGDVFLARDALGERTLYYARVGAGTVFASSIAQLLACRGVRRTVDPVAVGMYLSYSYVPGARTVIDGVSELLPGEVLRLAPNDAQSRRLWSIPLERRCDDVHEQDAVGELRGRLERAVLQRLPDSDAVGASLSGGVDSSLVVALLARSVAHPVRTFSVSFGRRYPSETPFSSLVAKHCAAQHRILRMSPRLVMRHLDETIAMLGKPIGDPLTVPNAIMFREASSEVGVMFNGEGGDPCFGGPKNVPMIASELFGGHKGGDPELARARTYLLAHQKCYEDLPLMVTDDVRAAIAGDTLERHVAPLLSDTRRPTLVNRLMAVNTTFKGAHHILAKIDQVSRPFGVLPRSPLFDRSVVEYAFSLPPQLKLHGSIEKYVLKRAVADVLPPVILARPKSGMRVPVEAWFRGRLRKHARERLLDGLAPYGLVERRYLDRLTMPEVGGIRRAGTKTWMLITLQAWLENALGTHGG